VLFRSAPAHRMRKSRSAWLALKVIRVDLNDGQGMNLLDESVAQHQPNTNPNRVQQKQIIGSHFTQRFADESLMAARISRRCSSSSCGLKKPQASPQALAYRSSNTWETGGSELAAGASRGEVGVDKSGSSIALLFASNCLSASSCLSNAALNRDP
jgi:hypothetical protein